MTGRLQSNRGRRSGAAILWVLIVLTLVSALVGLVMKDHYANRQFLQQRQKRLQADWLARAGIELATTRLVASEKPFKLSVTDIVANSKVDIEVSAAPNAKDTFLITSGSHFPTSEAHPVTRTQTRRVRRSAENGQVRLEAADAPAATK
jgi:hypothetical protein